MHDERLADQATAEARATSGDATETLNSCAPGSDAAGETTPVWLPFYPGRALKPPRGPSARNREIFQAVRVEFAALRETARRFSLSPTRIGQIVKQVEQWIALTNGRPEPGRTWAQQLAVAEYLHRERLDHLYGQALAGWNKSLQEQRTTKVLLLGDQPQRREVCSKSGAGNPRFLITALGIEQRRWEFEVAAGERRPEEMTQEQRIAEIEEIVAEVPPADDQKKQAADSNAPAVAEETIVADTPASPAECESSEVTVVPQADPPQPTAPTPAPPRKPAEFWRGRMPGMTTRHGPPDRSMKFVVTRPAPAPPPPPREAAAEKRIIQITPPLLDGGGG